VAQSLISTHDGDGAPAAPPCHLGKLTSLPDFIKVAYDGLERVSSLTLLDLLEVPQRDRSADTFRRLAKVMAELGWTERGADIRSKCAATAVTLGTGSVSTTPNPKSRLVGPRFWRTSGNRERRRRLLYPQKADIGSDMVHVCVGPCVDGSELARGIFTSQAWSVQPCVRPLSAVHMTAGHNALR
jgi:hypothetical protein